VQRATRTRLTFWSADVAEEEVMVNWKRKLLKGVLAGTLLLGFSTLSGAPTQAADRWSSCRNRRTKIEQKLERDVRRHGYRSRQAERDRNELRRLERSCGSRWRR
jgi:hypothetical protein